MVGTVIFLGAGATKSCDGPLTSEILPNIVRSGPGGAHVNQPGGRLSLIQQFLDTQFHVSPDSPNDQFPGLPLVMSLIDVALERRQAFLPNWDLGKTTELREAIEFGIFDHLEELLRRAQTNNHWQLLERLYPGPSEPQVISTNYDVIVDTALMALADRVTAEGGKFPDYRCRISSEFYEGDPKRFGVLLKLHGSLNWLYCRTCARLEIGASESMRYLKVLGKMLGPSLEQSYSLDGALCPVCHTKLRPLLIAPTHLKNYKNAHISQVWYEAEQVLRKAERVIFIGYSLPEDDVEVVYLLKRSLWHLDGSKITVVEYNGANTMIPVTEHSVGRRYRTLFGDSIHWFAGGLDGWLAAGMPGHQ